MSPECGHSIDRDGACISQSLSKGRVGLGPECKLRAMGGGLFSRSGAPPGSFLVHRVAHACDVATMSPSTIAGAERPVFGPASVPSDTVGTLS
jgi:hypothetical protein